MKVDQSSIFSCVHYLTRKITNCVMMFTSQLLFQGGCWGCSKIYQWDNSWWSADSCRFRLGIWRWKAVGSWPKWWTSNRLEMSITLIMILISFRDKLHYFVLAFPFFLFLAFLCLIFGGYDFALFKTFLFQNQKKCIEHALTS